MGSKAKEESMKIVPPGKKRCVWMEAGVVSYKLCDNNYDCPTCVYDPAMQMKVARQKEAAMFPATETEADRPTDTWAEKMMQRPASQRKCRYMLTGEVDRKICPNAYQCGTCSFDEMMQSRIQAEPLPVSITASEAGFDLASDMYYHEGHAWAKPEYGGRVRVGLDDFAQKLLGTLTQIITPDIGQEVVQGKVSVEMRKNGLALSALSPVDGIVSCVNPQLVDHPELLNESPYEKGWIFIVEPARLRKNLKTLHYGEEAGKFLHDEREKLFSMAHEDLRISADGGDMVEDLSKELKGENWTKFVRFFLKS